MSRSALLSTRRSKPPSPRTSRRMPICACAAPPAIPPHRPHQHHARADDVLRHKFTINQGSIAFYNPLKVEPVLNVDLETRARGIDVMLTVSGPLDKLNLTPRSDHRSSSTRSWPCWLPAATHLRPRAARRAEHQSAILAADRRIGAPGPSHSSPVAGRLQRFSGSAICASIRPCRASRPTPRRASRWSSR